MAKWTQPNRHNQWTKQTNQHNPHPTAMARSPCGCRGVAMILHGDRPAPQKRGSKTEAWCFMVFEKGKKTKTGLLKCFVELPRVLLIEKSQKSSKGWIVGLFKLVVSNFCLETFGLPCCSVLLAYCGICVGRSWIWVCFLSARACLDLEVWLILFSCSQSTLFWIYEVHFAWQRVGIQRSRKHKHPHHRVPSKIIKHK